MKYLKLYEELKDFEETWIEEEDKVKKHKLPKILVDFLSKENALDKFIDNFENEENVIFYDYAANTYSRHIISIAFNWNNTPEGNKFWLNINLKWHSLLVNADKYYKKFGEFDEINEKFEYDFEEVWEEDDIYTHTIDDLINEIKEYSGKKKNLEIDKNNKIYKIDFYFDDFTNVVNWEISNIDIIIYATPYFDYEIGIPFEVVDENGQIYYDFISLNDKDYIITLEEYINIIIDKINDIFDEILKKYEK